MTDRRRWSRVITWASIAALIPIALVMLVTGILDHGESDELDERGIEVPAEVLDIAVHTGGENGPTTTVTVRFKPRGDDLTKTTTDVTYSGDFSADHSKSDGVRVEYDPDDPSHARIVGETGDAVNRIIAGSVLTVFLTAFAIVYWRRPDLVGW